MKTFDLLDKILHSDKRIVTIFKCLLFYYLCATIAMLVIGLVDILITSIFGIPTISKTHWHSNDILSNLGLIKGVLLLTLLGPLFEELSFRLYLSFEKLSISVSLPAIVFSLSGPVFIVDNVTVYFVRLAICVFVGLTIYKYFDSLDIKNFISNHYKAIYVFSAVLFAVVHIGNFYSFQYEIWFLYPLYVAPQFFMGLILGWLRIKHGFWWAVLLHVIANGIAIWPEAISIL